jgi:hypothetical protein
MLYDEKMQYIEDDLVPFGAVDDGQESDKEVDNTGTVWETINTGFI